MKKAFLAELTPHKDDLSAKRELLQKAVDAVKAGLIKYKGFCLLSNGL